MQECGDFFAKPAGLDLARAVAAYLCIRFY